MKLPEIGFEHLHQHSMYSTLDGWASVEDLCKRGKSINQKYLCLSDHGTMSGIPIQIKNCEKYELNPIFACELYVNPLQIKVNSRKESAYYRSQLSDLDKKIFSKSYHLLAIAYNDIGYKNLVKLTSWAWIHGFYRKPRVNHEQLMLHKEGIIFSSCCYMSEIGQAFDGYCCTGGDESANQVLEKYMSMFGKNFRLELMMLDFKKQKPYDAYIIRAHNKYGIELILTNDNHYANQQDAKYQRYMLMVQTQRTNEDLAKATNSSDEIQDFFELQDQNLWMKSESELNDKWQKDYSDTIDYELFKQAKLNTVKICEMAKHVTIDRSSKEPEIKNAELVLKDLIIEGTKLKNIPKNKTYLKRIHEEYELICNKGYAGYFVILRQIIDEAKRVAPKIMGWGDGSEVISPGRGSAGGSLVLYCIGITDVDPIKHDLLFSRFLSENRGGRTMKLKFTHSPSED